jgi:DNA-binding response OmpR family regulator
MKVLIVEDEVPVGEVFRDLLLELGHEPVLVRSAEGALGLLQKSRLDAVILDMKLPGMSGIDFLQLRPVRESGVPVVVMSGVATEAEARECLRLGAIDFLDKPVPYERLHAVLASIEPQALFRLQVDAATRIERRHALRVPLPVPVRVLEYNGTAWDTSSVNVSTSGIKIHLVMGISPGAAVKLVFTLPDGGEPIQVMALLVRQDRDGYAFYFANLTTPGFERLSSIRGEQRPAAFARG